MARMGRGGSSPLQRTSRNTRKRGGFSFPDTSAATFSWKTAAASEGASYGRSHAAPPRSARAPDQRAARRPRRRSGDRRRDRFGVGTSATRYRRDSPGRWLRVEGDRQGRIVDRLILVVRWRSPQEDLHEHVLRCHRVERPHRRCRERGVEERRPSSSPSAELATPSARDADCYHSTDMLTHHHISARYEPDGNRKAGVKLVALATAAA